MARQFLAHTNTVKYRRNMILSCSWLPTALILGFFLFVLSGADASAHEPLQNSFSGFSKGWIFIAFLGGVIFGALLGNSREGTYYGSTGGGYRGHGGPPSEEEVKKFLEKLNKMYPPANKPPSNPEKEQK